MVRTIKAKYSKGVFEPLETVVAEMVSEGEEVLITISTISAVSGDPLRETSGGWKGLIDMEALKQNICADRMIATRPVVRL